MPEKTQVIHLPTRHDMSKIYNLPDEGEITDINKVSKSGPRYVSLKDHDEFSGKAIIVTAAEIIPGTIPDQTTGAINDYIRCVAAIYPPERKPTKEDVVILQTGAGDFARRISDAILANALPVRGILQKHGRAWSLA